MSKHRLSSGPYFSVFNPNTGKCGPEKTPYLDTFYAGIMIIIEGLSILDCHTFCLT